MADSGTAANNDSDMNILQKLWRYRKYIIIEPLILCWILPSCFLVIGIQNLSIEKACRLSLGYSKEICDNVLDKSISGIDCDALSLDDESAAATVTEMMNITEMIMETSTSISSMMENLMIGTAAFNSTVCKAEVEAQKQITFINGIRGPISSIFPIIVILFAGGWSDKKGLRKPCMIFPMIGELLSCSALLLSSIFMDTIPMEFGTILEKVLPAMLGGQTLMIMGIYSYLTATTAEEDRTFRFGIFGMFANIIPLFGLPLAGIFYTELGYVNLFILGDVFFLLGVLYLIFFVKEVKTDPVEGQQGVENIGQDNYGFEMTSGDNANSSTTSKTTIQNGISTEIAPPPTKRNCLAEFFDPTLAYGCIEVFLRKREHNRRTYLIILVLAYALFLGPSLGEIDYLVLFAFIQLKWDGEQYSLYSTYSTAIVTVGTFLMTGVFSKIFKMSDSMVGFLSAVCTIISRPMFAFAKESVLYYAGGTVDMFVSVKTIAIKSIISTMVVTEEIGRLYSVLGISDAIGGFIFPPIYSAVYSSTLETFPGAFYLFGEIFFIPNAILFAVTYFLLRNDKKNDEEQQRQQQQQQQQERTIAENGRNGLEVTHI